MTDCIVMKAVANIAEPDLYTWCCEECHRHPTERHHPTTGQFIHREVTLCCQMWHTAARIVEPIVDKEIS